jgi:SHS2 domain-containing protein
MSEGFRTFDHTGDLGLEVWAATPERLYACAAEALMAQVAIPRPGVDPGPESQIQVALEGADSADLFVHWLNTVLLESDTHRALWTRATIDSLTSRILEGRLAGPRLDPRRQEFLREIKAVSHHFLALDLDPPECRCRLVLDI